MSIKIMNITTILIMGSIITHSSIFAGKLPSIIAIINNNTSQEWKIATRHAVYAKSPQLSETISPGEIKTINLDANLEQFSPWMQGYNFIPTYPNNPAMGIDISLAPATGNSFSLPIARSNTTFHIGSSVADYQTSHPFNPQEVAQIIIEINLQEKSYRIKMKTYEEIEEIQKEIQKKLNLGQKTEIEKQRIMSRPQDIELEQLLKLQRK